MVLKAKALAGENGEALCALFHPGELQTPAVILDAYQAQRLSVQIMNEVKIARRLAGIDQEDDS